MAIGSLGSASNRYSKIFCRSLWKFRNFPDRQCVKYISCIVASIIKKMFSKDMTLASCSDTAVSLGQKHHRVRKVRATDPNRIFERFDLQHSIEGAFLLRYTNFGPISSFSFLREEKHFRNYLSSFFKKCRISSIDWQSSFSLGKISMQLRSRRSWIMSTRTLLHLTTPSPSELPNLKSQNMASKIHLERVAHPLSPLMKTFKP